MSDPNPKVDAYLQRAGRWRDTLSELRRIIRDCGLTEEMKWGKPCYTVEGRNAVIIDAYRSGCVLSFFKGALLRDPEGILEKPGENTRAARVVRFADAAGITALEPVLRAYLREAVELERSGASFDFAGTREHPIPDELRERFDASPELEAAFGALTPGRQREYLMHFSAAKQSATRAGRIEKNVERILAGKGLRDR